MNGLAEAMRHFQAVMKVTPSKPSQKQYETARAAYQAVQIVFGDDGMERIWAGVKAKDPAMAVFQAYSDVRTWIFHQTPEYKAYQRKYQAEWAAKLAGQLR